MVAVRLSAMVNEDRELIVKLPDNIPAGPVEVVIQLPAEVENLASNAAREAARAKLAAAGLLSTSTRLPAGTIIPTDAEVRAAGILPSGARSSEELIDEDGDETSFLH